MRKLLYTLAFLVLMGLPASASQVFSVTVEGCKQDGSNTPVPGIKVEWNYFQDPVSGRFVALGIAGQTTWSAGINLGIPPITRLILHQANPPLPEPCGGYAHTPVAPPGWPWPKFCVDTLKIGAKQPPTTSPSLLALAGAPLHGRPSMTVWSHEGSQKVETFCYDSASSDPDRRFPYLILQNQWDTQQNISFVIAGEVR